MRSALTRRRLQLGVLFGPGGTGIGVGVAASGTLTGRDAREPGRLDDL